MRRTEAPAPGWYPDPESRTSLRWWDGLDWTGARRAPPSSAELTSYEMHERVEVPSVVEEAARGSGARPPRGPSRADSQQIIDDVRTATREEVDRAADLLERRARIIAAEIEPLISQYSSRLFRWIRFAAIFATLLLIAWFVFQVVAQASLFEWIGDRIDNLTDNQSFPAP